MTIMKKKTSGLRSAALSSAEAHLVCHFIAESYLNDIVMRVL